MGSHIGQSKCADVGDHAAALHRGERVPLLGATLGAILSARGEINDSAVPLAPARPRLQFRYASADSRINGFVQE